MLFRLIDVLPPKPKYCKHMELVIFQDIAENIVNNGDIKYLLKWRCTTIWRPGMH